MKLITTAAIVLQYALQKVASHVFSPFEGMRKDLQFAKMRRELRKSAANF